MLSPLNEAAMSPANSFFLLACAALLVTAYGSGCSSAFIGEETADIINLEKVIMPRGQRDAVINVADNCKMQGKLLAGEGATACDYITAPDIRLGPDFTPVYVHRTNKLKDIAFVSIVQHCK